MTRRTIRIWYGVHTWTSLVCTAFLLLLCVTGLPLIFHHEIDVATGAVPHAPRGQASAGSGPGLLPLDTVLARALARHPGSVPLFMAFDDDDPLMTVTTGPRADAGGDAMTLDDVDRRTGARVGDASHGAVMAFVLQLHTDLFLGLGGSLLLAAMGVSFVAALVSGTVLYAPFMRKHDFGIVRVSRRRRIRWLDYHNLFGIVALAWMTVVGATGIVNALVTPITRTWQSRELALLTRDYAGQPPVEPADYASIDGAMAAARRAMPGVDPQFIAFPGGAFSSPHHFAVFFHGSTPLTAHVLTLALIDARTDRVTAVARMPWTFLALSMSRPLHFGDYGGLPLKILWAVLDLFAIVVLGSGLYLWAGRRHATAAAIAREVESGGRIALECAA